MLAVLACVRERGLTVEMDPYDYRLHFEFGEQRQQESAMTAVQECTRQIDATRFEPQPPLTEEQLRALYQYYVAQRDCLEVAGFPGVSPPPEQVFIDTDGSGWGPYDGTESMYIPVEVMRACERIPERPAFLDW